MEKQNFWREVPSGEWGRKGHHQLGHREELKNVGNILFMSWLICKSCHFY